jgi:nitroreductase
MKRLLDKVLPISAKQALRRLRDRLRNSLYWLFSKSEWLASIYFAFFSNAFRREHRAVLTGRLKHFTLSASKEGERYRLRRNIHRIEKGLIADPRRNVFALSYIEDTVELLLQGVANDPNQVSDESELAWAAGVLSRYFKSTPDHPTIVRAKERFHKIPIIPDKYSDRSPYPRKAGHKPPLDFNSLLELAHQRRSVRWYSQKEVPTDLLDRAFEVAAQAPSACNRQPYRFLIYRDRESIQRIAELAGGTEGFRENYPALIVIVGLLRAYAEPRDRHVIYIDAALASMSFMFALETLGLSSCALNWPDIPENERRMARLLDLDLDERVVMLMSVGYPAPSSRIAYSQKKPLEVLREYRSLS